MKAKSLMGVFAGMILFLGAFDPRVFARGPSPKNQKETEVGDTELVFFEKGQEPDDDKPTAESLLETLRLGRLDNLAFLTAAETLRLFQFIYGLKRAGKGYEEIVEKYLKAYADKGTGRELKDFQKLVAQLVTQKKAKIEKSLSQTTIRSFLNATQPDPRAADFLMPYWLRQIFRAQLRNFLKQSRRYERNHPALKSVRAEIEVALKNGAHDVYLIVLLGQVLESTKAIEVSKYKRLLPSKLSPQSLPALRALAWGVNDYGLIVLK